jgi:hypothetical protein
LNVLGALLVPWIMASKMAPPTMVGITSEQRTALSSLMLPVERLKEQRCLEVNNKFNWHELRLKDQPDSLKAFGRLFFKGNVNKDYVRIIWVRDVSCLEGNMELPQAYQQRSFDLRLISDSRHLRLCIHSSTLEEAISVLDFLAALQGSPEQR